MAYVPDIAPIIAEPPPWSPVPAPDENWSPFPPPPPPPDEAASASAISFSTGDQVIATCTNSTSPICYNTNLSGANLITNLWFSAILGALCYAGFVVFRAKFRFYQARLDMSEVRHKPPALKLNGFYRLWSWVIPVFRVSDEELLLSAGLDALIAVKILSFGILLLLPITIAAMAILIPINFTDNYYEKQAEMSGVTDTYTTVFIRMTMSNITPRNPILWVHFVFVYASVLWTCWLITEHYKEYIALRQAYCIRSTELPCDALGGSIGAVPCDGPRLLAARSPMKKKHILAKASFGKKGESGGTGSTGSTVGTNMMYRKVHTTRGAVQLPPRDVSGGSSIGAPEVFSNHHHMSSHGNNIGMHNTTADAAVGEQPLGRPSRLSGSLQAHSKHAIAPSGTVLQTVGDGIVDSNAAFYNSSGQQQQYSDWTSHDFSRDVLHPQLSNTHDTTSIMAMNTATSDTLSPLPPPPSLPSQQHPLWSPPPPSSQQRPLAGQLSQNSMLQTSTGPLRRTPSNAAVAAALDPGRTSSAAEALAKIRHHRAMSGTSNKSGTTPQVTPPGGSTPREEHGLVGPLSSPSKAHFYSEEMRKTELMPPPPPRQHSLKVTPQGDPAPPVVDDTVGNNGAAATASAPSSSLHAPPDLSAIITAVQNLADSRAHDADNGIDGYDLPTVVATAPDYMNPHGNEGVSSRWWNALSALGNRMIERRRSGRDTFASAQSITIKGAVPLMQLDTGSLLAVNASLYTVLVTDQPVERLRLKKPLGNMEFWHHRSDANIFGLVTSQTDEMATPEALTPVVGDRETFRRGHAYHDSGGDGDEHGDVEHGFVRANASTRSGGMSDYETALDANGASAKQLQSVPTFSLDCTNQPTHTRKALHINTTTRRTASTAAASGKQSSMDRQSTFWGMGDATETGINFSSGWGTTFNGMRQWWNHRSRYKEWRRDVRWAMFNRRVRIATEMFTELFGDDFDAIVPIYPTQSVDKLIHQWDAAAAALERAQLKLKELAAKDLDDLSDGEDEGAEERQREDRRRHRGAKRNQKMDKLKQHIKQLGSKVTTLQRKITAERDSVLSDLPSTCFFATFKSQEAAAVAAQANLNPINQRLFNVEAAPSPDDVNWPALTRSWWERQARPVYTLPLILFIMLLPIGAFTGAFAQITIALCGNGMADSPALASDSWYCSDNGWARFLRNLMTSLAPSILLSLYHMVILPVLVYYAAQAEGQCYSLSKLDRRCADLFFYWDVFNVFLGAMLGGSILAELPTYLNHPSTIWRTLSSSIPASSNFFINYVSYRALVMAWFRLFYPHQAVVACIFKWLRIIPWAKTPRDKAFEAPVRNCRYGRDIGIPVLMNFVMVLAYAVVSPLILPFGLLYFIFLWAVWRYQMLYVYQRQYESGGQFWPFIAHKVVGCTLICVIFTAFVLIFKEGYAQGIILLVTIPVYLLRFDMYLTNRYDAVVAQVPLMAVHKAGRVQSVDPNLWTPAPLRQGATGWNPQWGRVWHWWGVPMYTL